MTIYTIEDVIERLEDIQEDLEDWNKEDKSASLMAKAIGDCLHTVKRIEKWHKAKQQLLEAQKALEELGDLEDVLK